MNHKSRKAIGLPSWLVGGNVFYLLSAVCIMLGVTQIIAPLYQQLDPQPGASLERFYCLLALNAYELALMVVVLVILLWKNVTDDAVGLTLLISVFMIGSAVALDTIAPDLPAATLCFGTGGLFLAFGKLFALEQYITGNWRRWMLIWILPLLVWNFLMPAVMGYAQSEGLLVSQLTNLWLVGSYLLVLAAIGLWAGMLNASTGTEIILNPQVPFLHRPLMRWIIVFALLAATAAHQWALVWSFALPLELGELLPTFGLIAFILMELMRLYCKQDAKFDIAIVSTIIVATYGIVLSDSYSTSLASLLGIHVYPPVFLFLMAAGLGIKSLWPRISKQHPMVKPSIHAYLAIALGSAGALIIAIEPTAPVEFQIAAASTVLAMGMAIMAWVHRSAYQFNLAALIFVVGVSIDPPGQMANHDLSLWTQIGLGTFAYGVLCLPIHIYAFNKIHWQHTLANTLALTAGTMITFVLPQTLVWDLPLWMPIIILLAIALASWPSKHWLNPPVGLLALLIGIYQQFQNSPGWLMIVASFIILGIGAAASIIKAGLSDGDDPHEPIAPVVPTAPTGPVGPNQVLGTAEPE